MYAVMGLTGQVGGQVARTLLAGAQGVRGIVRNPSRAANWKHQGVTLATADQADASALAAALASVEGAFVMLPPMFVQTPGFPEARPLIDALRRALADAAPPRVVVLSTIGAQHAQGNGILGSLNLLERSLATLAMPVTFLRAAWFMENTSWDVQAAFDAGRLTSFLQPLDRPFPMVSTADVGHVAAETLVRPWVGQRVIELEGPRRYTPNDVAAALQTIVRRPVRPSIAPRSEWSALFESEGVSAESAAMRAEMLDGFNSGHIDFVGAPAAEHLYGKVTLDDAVARLVSI